MAYLSKEKTAEIRENLKKAFPSTDGWKFSIRNRNHSTIDVAILAAPVRFHEEDYKQLNPYYLNTYMNADILKQIEAICMDGNFDNSDISTDYFHVGWYFSLSQGEWNKPFTLVEGKQTKKQKGTTGTQAAPGGPAACATLQSAAPNNG